MTAFLVQLDPQRSTHYSPLVSQFMPYEIELSPTGKQLTSTGPVELGG